MSWAEAFVLLILALAFTPLGEMTLLAVLVLVAARNK